jgi:small-conductance mechanosensitive channel
MDLVAFQFISIDLTCLAIVLSFLPVGIGFGLQNITPILSPG